MITFEYASGEVRKDGVLIGSAYSGKGTGKNNPACQPIHNFGPIPCGLWEIVGPPFDDPEHGRYCLRLRPADGTETYGRDGFLWHGDNPEHLGESSEGCLVSLPAVRSRVWQSSDRQLRVVPGKFACDVDGEIAT